MAVQYMRRIIQKRAKFDIMDLNVLRGDKNIIKFDGDHNSPRPQSYYDSVSIFFYKSLHPPLLPAARSKLHMGAFKVGNITNENFFFEIINGLRPANTAGCSSSTDAPNIPHDGTSVIELLSDSMNQLSIKNENHLDFLLDENHSLPEIDSDSVGSRLQDKRSRRNEESFSFTSSNRESWGRCSSLGAASDESFSGDNNDKQNLTVKALATPVRQNQRQSQRKPIEKAKQKKIQALWKKIKREKVEMGDSLSSRLKMCLGQSPQHKRNRSSGTITTS
ncbi:alpha/beta-Hydrolases superfamily protein [Zea mays]|uniref:Alpha/beta-Hydrolases superfamily protein n=2 Tax=Zea mays TaxID=4577 RepID=A0A1D6H422_MAIZE|nr:alpha/beta-Hydrolases superfamily protein [Zea mays]